MSVHLVFGAGLIGCYLAGALDKQGLRVHVFCRPRIKQQLTDGLFLTDYQGGEYKAKQLVLHDELQQIQDVTADFVWLTVKCHSVAAAVEQLQCVVTDKTVILCCQNGLGSEHIVRQAFPEHLVLRVMVPFNVVEVKPGHLHRGSEGRLTLEQQVITDALAPVINSNLLPVDVSGDMSALLWAKLQLNLGNAVNALADIPVKAMLEQREYRQIIAALMDELLQVVASSGIKLPKVTAVKAGWIPVVLTFPDWIFKRVANKMLAIDPQVRTSMWWDLQGNKKTEIDYLNGAVVQQGQVVGVSCPVNQRLINLIKDVEGAKLTTGLTPGQLKQALELD